MIQIIPAVLETTEKGYSETIGKINASENLQDGWVQIDFTDNKFVQNQTIGLTEVKNHPTELLKEAHLMVEDPINWLEALKELDFKRVIFHIESGEALTVIDKAKVLGLEVGVSLKNETSLDELENLLSEVDVVQLMSIDPGFQGRPFIPQTLDRIEQLTRLRTENKVHFLIGVDGGLNFDTIPQVIKAGADNLVIGSSLVKGDIDENLEAIWEILNS